MCDLKAGNIRRSSIFPAASEREQWQKASESKHGKRFAEYNIQEAEKLLEQPIPQLTAELFMRFIRKGNRVDYERVFFEKRRNLAVLVLAECFEYKGRFIDKIIDYMWDISAEHTWCLPAHIKSGSSDPLPFLKHEQIDLFASSTGMDLALTLNLLEPELKAVSPNLVKLVRQKLLTRIVEPLEIRPFPFNFIKKVNNWRPWCSRNCLVVILTVLNDQPERQQKLIDFFKAAMTDFIGIYSADGCCNEGPHYWCVSPAIVLTFYELLGEMPEDKVKYAMMGDYITHALMTDRYFASFADAVATTDVIPAGICYRFGERVGNPRLKALGQKYLRFENQLRQRSNGIINQLCDIFWIPSEVSGKESVSPRSFKYYDRLQILFLKDRDTAFAAKRGFFSNHYHMDIGQFILFYQTQPVIIDLGGTVYTRDTFSDRRYENWVINSKGHNVPDFNGVGQLVQPPQDVAAAEVINNDKHCIFKMDLTSAYPAEAQLIKCTRTITYSYIDQSVEVEDRWELKRDNNTVKIPLYSPAVISGSEGKYQIADMTLNVMSSDTKVQLNTLNITDEKVSSAWGNKITRIDLITSGGKTGSCKIRLEPAGKK